MGNRLAQAWRRKPRRSKRRLLGAGLPLILALGGLLGCASREAHRNADNRGSTISVLTYNIHHGEGMDGELDLARIANVIIASRADVVALQEVDRVTERTGNVDQAAQLARLTGMHVLFGRAIDLGSGQYGNAILSKFPVEMVEIVPLRTRPGLEARCALVARVSPPPARGKPFLFLATHLHNGSRAKTDRLAGIEDIARAVEKHGDGPMLLAGDLNARPDSGEILRLRETWWIAGSDRLRATSPAPAPTSTIDYVCYRPADRWRTVELHVIEERVASDHRPVLAILKR